MLCLFDGTNTISDIVILMVNLFHISRETAITILTRYTDGGDFSIKTENQYQYIPPAIIVQKKQGLKYETYNRQDFESDNYSFCPPDRLENPLTANILLTMSCYTDCIYCYADRTLKRSPAFSHQNITRLIQEARKLNMANVDINGGDVLLYPHWADIVKVLTEEGFSPLISTKKPLQKADVDNMIKSGITEVQFSLDSAIPEEIEKLQRLNGSKYIQDVKKGFQLVPPTLSISINTVLTSINANRGSIESLLSFLSEFDCVKKISFTPAGFSLYKQTYRDFAPTRSQITSLLGDIDSVYKAKYSRFEIGYSVGEYPPDHSNNGEFFRQRAYCTGNTRNVVILPDGRVTICEELYAHPTFIIGDLKFQTLEEVWKSSRALDLFHMQKESVQGSSPCKNCCTFHECREGKGVCWKTILMAYGVNNWTFPDPMCPKAPEPHRKYWLE